MRLLSLALVSFALLACTNAAVEPDVGELALKPASGVVNSSEVASHTYRVTIENLTTSQPLSPGIVVTHTKSESLFTEGESASEGVRLIAENGDPSVALEQLAMIDGVDGVVSTGAPVGCINCAGPFGQILTLDVEAGANANRLSLAIMLICTNDGFAGLDGVPLPGGSGAATYLAYAYDAGTEANAETWASIVDPCGAIGPVSAAADGMNERDATMGTVQQHPGIAGTANLGVEHGWNGPIARVTVERVM